MALHEVRKLANARKAIFDNPKQIEISEKHLSDLMLDVIQLVWTIRDKIDESFFKKLWLNKQNIDYTQHKHWLIRDKNFYPIWFCDDIRNHTFNILNSWKIEFIDELKKNWTIIKSIYWIYDKNFFHNAIQFWDYFLDVWNDSVEINQEKISCSRLWDSLFENFDNYSDYCDIVQDYRKVEVYPNIYFPELAFIFPFFIINNFKLEFIWQHTALIFKDALDWFKEARNFIFNSKYSNKRLNDEQIKILESYKEKLLDNWVELNIKELKNKKRYIDISELNDNIIRVIIVNSENKRKLINSLEINLNNPWN